MYLLWLSIKKINVCNVNEIEYDFSNIQISIMNKEQRTYVSFVGQISDMCNIPISEAKEIYFYSNISSVYN